MRRRGRADGAGRADIQSLLMPLPGPSIHLASLCTAAKMSAIWDALYMQGRINFSSVDLALKSRNEEKVQ